jgi:hypothetical protein
MCVCACVYIYIYRHSIMQSNLHIAACVIRHRVASLTPWSLGCGPESIRVRSVGENWHWDRFCFEGLCFCYLLALHKCYTRFFILMFAVIRRTMGRSVKHFSENIAVPKNLAAKCATRVLGFQGLFQCLNTHADLVHRVQPCVSDAFRTIWTARQRHQGHPLNIMTILPWCCHLATK